MLKKIFNSDSENQSDKITRSFDNSKIIKPFSVLDVPQHALVIGNAAYEYAALTNPVNDATDVAQRLEEMGFNVSKALDLNQVAMGKAIRTFTTRLSQEPGLGLFYFAGHGFQVDGENYLIPIDNKKIEDKHDLQAYAINVNLQILDRMEIAKNHLNFIILDACRNNPFRGAMRSHQQGLASVNSVMGSIIAFATAPGKTAADKSQCGHNGLFTKYLLEGLEYAEEHNQRVEDMFMQVRNSVLEESGGDQIPWYTASLMKPFYFGKIQPESKSEPKIEEKVTENEATFKASKKPSTGEEFSFEVVTVDAKGKITNRKPHTATQLVEQVNGVSLEMVYIPSGEFMMVSPKGEGGDREKPQHKVIINKPFYMGKYPVRQAQWQAVMGNNPSNFKGENKPVEKVSWDDAIVFCEKLSKTTGNDYGLPSEAEWEYACRAGTTTPFYFGETITTDLANYGGTRKETTDVGQFPPNAFGLYDMHGNVWEWVFDSWHKDYTNAPNDGRIWEKGADKSHRVLRGGSWSYGSDDTRAAYRDGGNPGDRGDYIGFRVVRRVVARIN